MTEIVVGKIAGIIIGSIFGITALVITKSILAGIATGVLVGLFCLKCFGK